MEKKATTDDPKRDFFARISHDLHVPIVGIRNNVNFLQMGIGELDRDTVERKLDDILYFSEILLLRLAELDVLSGLTSPTPRLERVFFCRDILVRSIRIMVPLLAERGFSVSQIDYDGVKLQRAFVYADREKLQLVVSNLLINSIKCANDDPEEFRIQIEVDETSDSYIIKFKDWGLGIKAEYEQKGFEEGFCEPEIVVRVIGGKGLGLAISKRIMVEMGGELQLVNRLNPTEFHMMLPKMSMLE